MPLPTNYVGIHRLNARSNRVILLSMIAKQSWINPLALDDDGVSVAVAGPNTVTVNATIGGALASGGKVILDYPRPVLVTVTHGSAVVALSGVISGLDLDGKPMTEAWSVTAGGTTKTGGGTKAFKVVTGVTVIAAADASADTVKIGTTAKLGLDVAASHPSPLKELTDGTAPTAGVITIESTTADPRGLFAPNTAPDGAHDYDLWYLTDDPWNS